MQDLSPNGCGRTDIVPTRKLPNGKNVAVAQGNIALFVSAHCRGNVDIQSVARSRSRSIRVETREIRFFGIRASLESAGYADQVFDAHVCGERITSRLGYLAVDIHGRRIHPGRIA